MSERDSTDLGEPDALDGKCRSALHPPAWGEWTVKFWQAILVATLTADFIQTRAHGFPWWAESLAEVPNIILCGLLWLAAKHLFTPDPANPTIAKEPVDGL